MEESEWVGQVSTKENSRAKRSKKKDKKGNWNLVCLGWEDIRNGT